MFFFSEIKEKSRCGGHSVLGSEGPALEPISILSPWESLFTCISSPHSGVKGVPGYRQWKILSVCESEALVIWLLLCYAPLGVEKDIFGWL